ASTNPDQPFQTGAPLEPGVHLHWALPDGLTRGVCPGSPGDPEIEFPAVPDRWLVVRFNPPPSATAAPATGPVLPSPPMAGIVAAPITPGAASTVGFNFGHGLLAFGLRNYSAWIVDSYAETVTPLDAWSPPPPALDRDRLTAVGRFKDGKVPRKAARQS